MALRNEFIEYTPPFSEEDGRVRELTAGFIKKLQAQSTIHPTEKTSWLVIDYDKPVGGVRRATGYQLSGGPMLIYRLNTARPDQTLLNDAFSVLKGLDVQAIRHKDWIFIKHEALMVCISWSQDQRASQSVIEANSSTQQLEDAVCLGEVSHG